MTRSHLSRRIIATSGAATLVAAAAAVAAFAPANAASTTSLSGTFAYPCAMKAGALVLHDSDGNNFVIQVGASVTVPSAVYPAQTIAARTVNITLGMPAQLQAATVQLLGGVKAEGSSTDAYVTATTAGKTSTYKIPKLSAPKASIPATGTWNIKASGTVPAMKTPANAATSVAIGMPAKFDVTANVYNAKGDKTVVTMNCTGPKTLALGSIPVTPDNPPTAAAVKATTKKNKAVTVTLKGADKDTTDKLTYKVGKAKHGKVTVKGNKATYTPTKNYTGKDSFTYTVSDGKADPVKATVSITVSK